MDKIRDIIEKYILNRTIFKLLIVIAMMVTSVPYLHALTGGYVKFLLLYGYLILAYEVFTKKFFSVLKDKINFVLFAFCGSYFISIILNRSMNLGANIKALAYMVIVFVLLYMTRADKDKRQLNKEIELISAVIILCTVILSAVTFITYAFSISGQYVVDGKITYYGMYDNRLWGIYNANTGSTLNSISILLSAGFIAAHKKKITCIILNSLNILLQFCCLILTGSRAPMYTLLAILSVFVFLTTVSYCVKKFHRIKFKEIGAGVLAAVMTVLLFTVSSLVIKNGLAYVPSITSNMISSVRSNSSDSESDFTIEKTDLNRLEETENREGGIFTGRMDIWKICFKTFKENPVFGVTRENIYEKSLQHFDNDLWKESLKIGGPHNIYVCILVSSGAVGFLFMLAFASYTFIKACINLLKNIKSINIWMTLSLLIVTMFYITEFVESHILYQMNIFYVIFWLYCGYMSAFANRTAEKE